MAAHATPRTTASQEYVTGRIRTAPEGAFGTRLPPQGAALIDRGSPRRFHRSITWNNVTDDVCHGQRSARL
jgi:hypothetical protein